MAVRPLYRSSYDVRVASVFPQVNPASRTDAAQPRRAALRRDTAVRAIVRNWRVLTRGTQADRTLIACSGGADSCALVAALGSLSTATDRFVVGHVVHDLRAESEALADRDAARAAAANMGLEFAEAHVRVRAPGKNLEAAAREARYAALVGMAREHDIRFIATAHHADDQVETVVMSLLRGTAGGGAGLRGMAAKRRISDLKLEISDVKSKRPVPWLIRPMLTPQAEVDRAACQRICDLAGIHWREDATNADISRLRAAVRHRVVPILREIRPDVARRAMAAAEIAELATNRLERAARRVLQRARVEGKEEPHEFSWPRAELRPRDPLLLGAVVRMARRRLCGRAGEDRAPKRSVDAVVRAIRDASTEARHCRLGGMEIEVTARRVVMRGR